MTSTVDLAPAGAALPPPQPESRVADRTGRRVRRRDRLQPYARPLLAVALVGAAYHVSFQTLLDSLSLDTPLAHLALVPLIALGLMAAGSRLQMGPPIHDRQLDWIVGVPLVIVALFANFVLPSHLSTEFWVYRIDLISLPFFVAGVVTLLFGVRMLWRLRLGVLFLFLAWPYPYTLLLDRWMVPFTAVTVRAVTLAVDHIAVATPTPGGGANALFTVAHAGKTFDLSVASECSGANGLLGFCLVAIGFLSIARGRRRAKALWLFTGAALVWALNVVRILIIFGTGEKWGQKVAIDGFHPVIGLVVFNVGILVMALLLPRFGLNWDTSTRRVPVAPGSPLAPPPRAHRPAFQAGAIVVAMSALGVGVLNTDLRDSDLVASSLGSPRLSSFQTSQEKPDGWKLRYTDRFDWTKRFFGPDSDWSRYIYIDDAGLEAQAAPGAAIRSNAPIIADVITTKDRSAFSNYGIEACYRFHNFKITKRQSVDLGNGVVGGLLTWRDPVANSTTTTLYWHWPIKQGSTTRWERVTLLVIDSTGLTFSRPAQVPESLTKEFQLRVRDVLKGDDSGSVTSDRLVLTRQFLVGFAQHMIELRGMSASATS